MISLLSKTPFHFSKTPFRSSFAARPWLSYMAILAAIVAVVASGCKSTHPSSNAQGNEIKGESEAQNDEFHYLNPDLPPRQPAPNGIEGGLQRATFAGGCFWCMETPFEDIPGVKSVTSGYTGGTFDSPSYKAVSSHSTDQMEAIDIIFDPKVVSYKDLLKVYWRQIDPTDNGGQFVDRGTQYRPFIWVHNDEQRREAEASKEELAKSGRFNAPITVPIVDAVTFWPAENYHQDFYKKDPERYHSYRAHSGRDQFLQKYWSK